MTRPLGSTQHPTPAQWRAGIRARTMPTAGPVAISSPTGSGSVSSPCRTREHPPRQQKTNRLRRSGSRPASSLGGSACGSMASKKRGAGRLARVLAGRQDMKKAARGEAPRRPGKSPIRSGGPGVRVGLHGCAPPPQCLITPNPGVYTQVTSGRRSATARRPGVR